MIEEGKYNVAKGLIIYVYGQIVKCSLIYAKQILKTGLENFFEQYKNPLVGFNTYCKNCSNPA